MSKKKIWSVPVALIVVLTVAFLFRGITVSADTDTSGTCGDNATWTYEDGTLTISGTGSLYSYNVYSSPWNNYRTYVSDLVIEEGITYFGNRAFLDLENLKTVSFPASLQTISFMAFSELSELTTVTIAEGSAMQSIGNNAFADCTKLQTINLPDTVKYIGDNSFYNCKNLVLTSLPANVESIGVSAFEYCTKVAPASFPSTLTVIDDSAFDATGVTSVSLPAGMEYIGKASFTYCENLTSVELVLDGNVEIGINMFGGCENLESVTITGSMSEIPDYMFNNCTSLTTLTLPNTITSIGDSAFVGCSSLAMTIPSGVTKIGNQAFSGTALTTVNFSKDITYGEKVFAECPNLSTVTIDNGVTAIPAGTFSNCAKLETVTLPDTLTSIGENAFASSGLTAIAIPAGVENIPGNAFNYCSSLEQVTLNEGLVSIGSRAFEFCTSLQSISIPSTVTSYGNRAFACSGLTSITLTLNDTSGNAESLFSGCNKLKTVVINGNLTTVADGLFYDCSSLTSITLPDTITAIGSMAFENCTSLTSFAIPSTVTRIGARAFYNSGITSAVVPDSVTDFGTDVFCECKKLQSAKLPSGLTEIPSNTFASCTSLKTFEFPENITSIGYGAFNNCGLTYLSIPGTVSYIDYGAFRNCKSLSAVEIHEGVQTISESAFDGCLMETLVLPASCASGLDYYAFTSCSNLKTVYCTSAVKNIVSISNSKANYILIDNADSIIARIAGHSITLSADIGVNFYVVLPVEYDSSNTTVEFTWGEGIDANTQQSYVHNVTATLTPVFENGANYVVTCGVAARALGDKITMVVKSGNDVLLTDEYSVIEYINVIDKGSYDVKLHRLVHSLVLYGAGSQFYFDYKTDTYVDTLYTKKYSDYNNEVSTFYGSLYTIEAPDAADMTIETIENDDLGLKYYGASVICASQTKMRFYFEVTNVDAFNNFKDSATYKSKSLTFKNATVGGQELVYIETPGLAPGALENVFVISIAQIDYRYDFKDFLRKVMNSDQYSKFMSTAMGAYTFSHFSKKFREA